MGDQTTKKRGRPQKLRRDHVVSVALESYWASGPTQVSVNEICKRAHVSKPGLYREFGNEDGLKRSVLDAYCDTVLSPLFDVLRVEQPFSLSVAAVTKLFLQARTTFASPRGCLLREMTSSRDQLGTLTQEAISAREQHSRAEYSAWIERALDRGDIRLDVPLEVAAIYVELQFGNAMTLVKREESDETIDAMMKLAFSNFY